MCRFTKKFIMGLKNILTKKISNFFIGSKNILTRKNSLNTFYYISFNKAVISTSYTLS